MSEKFLFLLTGIIALTGCQSHMPDIRTLCLRDGIGNYIIKWESDPPLDGVMKLYVSEDPDNFNKSRPVSYTNINEAVTTYITSDNITRKYFMLTFNDKYPQIVSSRAVMMDNIQNLRDLGGYHTPDDKMTRWGKVYRSGEIGQLSAWDKLTLSNLGIKTIIDLRMEEEIEKSPIDYQDATIVNIPVSMGDIDGMYERMVEERVRKGDGILFMQDVYLHYVTDNSDQFAKALDVFLDKDNYPIVFSCTYGKDRVGFLAALLLYALGVPEDTIYRDYVSSNNYINFRQMDDFALTLSSDAQEAMTAMLRANEAILDLALRKIRKDYGSVDKYLSTELNLTEKKRNQLKDMLLF